MRRFILLLVFTVLLTGCQTIPKHRVHQRAQDDLGVLKSTATTVLAHEAAHFVEQHNLKQRESLDSVAIASISVTLMAGIPLSGDLLAAGFLYGYSRSSSAPLTEKAPIVWWLPDRSELPHRTGCLLSYDRGRAGNGKRFCQHHLHGPGDPLLRSPQRPVRTDSCLTEKSLIVAYNGQGLPSNQHAPGGHGF